MNISKDLENIINSGDILEKLENKNFINNFDNLTQGIVIEKLIINKIRDSNYFENYKEIPKYFSKSLTGGYNFRNENYKESRVLFEIDDINYLNSELYYIEVKSGKIPNSYLDQSYKKRKNHSNTNVDVKRIFSISEKNNLNPKLIVFHDINSTSNMKLIKRIKREFRKKIFFVGFEYDRKRLNEFLDNYNSKLKEKLKEKYYYKI